MDRLVRLTTALVAALIPVLLLPVADAQAYSGGNAAGYADTWANSYNPSYPEWGEDCTNFVSQAVFAGGYSMVGFDGNPYSDYNWYMDLATWAHSNSWPATPDYKQFLTLDYPGGWDWGTAMGTAQYSNSGLYTGDVLFYDWTSDGVLDHASIQVGYGTDPGSGWVGSLVDAHTSNHYHAFWTLEPYNWNSAGTTTIHLEHIDAANQ